MYIQCLWVDTILDCSGMLTLLTFRRLCPFGYRVSDSLFHQAGLSNALGLGCLSVGAHTTSGQLPECPSSGALVFLVSFVHRHQTLSSCLPVHLVDTMCPYQCNLFLLITSWIASTSACFLMSSLVLWSDFEAIQQHSYLA